MIICPSRQLILPASPFRVRNPRKCKCRRSWIDRLLDLMSTNSGDTMLDDNGIEILDSTGGQFISDGTNTSYCGKCGGCVNTPPTYCTVSVSSFLMESYSTCMGGPGGNRYDIAFGGTYSVPLVAAGSPTTACTFRYTESGVKYDFKSYDACCSILLASYTSNDATKTVSVTLRTDGTLDYCGLTIGVGGGAFGSVGNQFNGTASRPRSDCLLPWTIPNGTHHDLFCTGATGVPASGDATVTF